MEKFKRLIKWYHLTLVTVFLFAAVVFAAGKDSPGHKPTAAEDFRADIIHIDTIKVFGDLERPSVIFPHDKHTDAVKESGGDCMTCHETKGDTLLKTFKGADQTGRKAVMDNFHINCIECHDHTAADNQPSGPVTCNDCHQETPRTASSRQPAGLDNSLHARHLEAYDQKCEACHTDCKTDAHKKGEETTCRHCHMDDSPDNEVISFQKAAHESCIDCHMKRAADQKTTGPVKCAGCHDLKMQQQIEKMVPVPRLAANQPDIRVLKTGDVKLDQPGTSRMDFVAFNHKNHEMTNDTCRVCHHKGMSACNSCHTVDGSEKSKGVTLEQAMHKKDSEQSCMGCHQELQHQPQCAGCHGFLSKTDRKDDKSCLMCHVKIPNAAMMDETAAKKMIEQRPDRVQMFDAGDIPDKITINTLSDKYEAVEFPHRQIINKIADTIKDDKLAAYFHDQKATLCQGCHHHSPATEKPTSCSSCHGKPFDEKNMAKPGIMGAYHIQCMECHTQMKVGNNGCTDCHEKKQ